MQRINNWYKSTFIDHSFRGTHALLFLRVIIGIFLMFHGYTKILTPFSWMGPESNVPGFFQFLSALAEFGGGLCIILGILFPLVCFGVMCSMLVATLTHLFLYGDPIISATERSAELAIMYLIVSIFFLSSGPGRLSLDKFVFASEVP